MQARACLRGLGGGVPPPPNRNAFLTMPRDDLAMSTYARPNHPGATVFFTVNLVARGSDLLIRNIETLRDVARRTRQDKPFRIDAWVVLPDHMHCIWTLPEGDADYSNRMGMLKARFTKELRRSGCTPTPVTTPNQHGAKPGRLRVGVDERVGVHPDLHRDESAIWQKRFWEHHIRDDRDYAAHMQYCWMNPVKHGLVERVEDWPYSSWHRDRGRRVGGEQGESGLSRDLFQIGAIQDSQGTGYGADCIQSCEPDQRR